MENHKNSPSPPTPQLCTAGCGFYGNEHFLGLCSKCYGAKNKGTTSSKPTSPDSNQLATADQFTFDKHNQADVPKPDDATILRRKHPRPSSSILSDDLDYTKASSSTSSPNTTKPSIATPVTTTAALATATTTTIPKLATASSTAVSTEANTPKDSDKPIQLNKGRCFICRIKVPLAKQTINKCRCDYVFCDSHRFPDRHDCDVDYAKIGRDLLAKNNPKLHERPKGGRSFRRIDSL